MFIRAVNLLQLGYKPKRSGKRLDWVLLWEEGVFAMASLQVQV